MNRPSTELQERAEALERRLADTGDFVERQWKEIERREAERQVHEAELELHLERSRRLRLEAEEHHFEERLRLDQMRWRIRLVVTSIILLISAGLILVGTYQLVLGSSSTAVVSGLGSLGTYLGLLAFEAASTKKRNRAGRRTPP